MSGNIGYISTATPEHAVHVSDRETIGECWLGDEPVLREKYVRICSNSGVKERNFIQPYKDIIVERGLSERTALFEEYGTALLCEAISDTLMENEIAREDVKTLIMTSCSMPSIPSIDALAIERLNLPATTSRIPIFQHGCAGGVVALGLASRLASSDHAVVVASVELCSLVFQKNNHSGTQLVGGAIFADGAAACVVGKSVSARPTIESVESILLKGTRALMGYEIHDDGFHLRLDRALPRVLLEQIPVHVETFLNNSGLTQEEVSAWLFHPGGVKILDYLSETLSLERASCRWSYDVLADHGNMSSATIYFVLNRFLRTEGLEQGEHALIVGIGPGLTLELVLIRG